MCTKPQDAAKESSRVNIDMKVSHTDDEQEAKIVIHTLKPFSGFGAGSYSMSSLKQMSPTDDFLSLPVSKRGCSYENRQLCLRKNYLGQKIRDCKCIPWEFPKEPATLKVSN